MANILEVKNLNKVYSDSDFQLKDVTFSIPYGSIVGFIGENGAGKTTTMGTILGTLKKNSGYIEIFGDSMNDRNTDLKEGIGVVLDSMNFSANLDVAKLSKVMSGIYQQWDHEKYDDYIDLFSLPKKLKIKEFSRGMSMKLSLAVALSHNAKLLILDEATAGLDPVAREDLLEVFLDFVKDKQRSILLSSHITSDIEKVADDLIFIKKGEIILKVGKEELLDNYAILQCDLSKLKEIEKSSMIAYKNKGDDVDVLVANKNDLPVGFHQYKKNFSIDEMTMLLMRGEKQ